MDPFSSVAKLYTKFRPTYPKEFVERLGGGLCLDVGCGSGQLSVALAERFTSVHAVDRSQAQLDNARQHPRVTYFCHDASLAGFPSCAYDCVTVAQAFHWMDPERVLPEFHRVLKPQGVLAVMGYATCRIDGRGAQHELEAYQATLKWECDRRRLDAAHADDVFAPPFAHVERVFASQQRQLTKHEFLNYLRSQTSYRGENTLAALANALPEQVVAHFPFFMILATRSY
ncbi:hypothetical protein BASA81_004966 [Batrachochytrium salamandrivorans]|nr:hypothetical protein BASA81_004966 [Batrachochytrium salamandrivorans]